MSDFKKYIDKERKRNMKIDVEKYVNATYGLISMLDDRKESVEAMLESIGDRYFSCPASTKEDYHGAYPGGLVMHSVEQTKLLMKMHSALSIDDEDVSKSSLILCGLFHDIGKIGTLDGVPQYIVQDDEWRRNKLGEMYKWNEELKDGLTHAQRSVRILMQSSVKLSNQEYDSILHHDGLYVPENQNKEVLYSKNKLYRLLSFTDSWITFVEKT